MEKINNIESFIKKSNDVHNFRYNYETSKYTGSKKPISIICPDHGVFYQIPKIHYNGGMCPKCANIIRGEKKKKSLLYFINKFKEIHGDKYDYSKIKENEISSVSINEIVCCKHGSFFQRTDSHIGGSGCPKCNCIDTEIFIKKAIGIHGTKYNYSKVNYVDNNTFVTIICPFHGEFMQKPHVHYFSGCQNCAIEIRTKTIIFSKEKFLNKAKEKFSNKFNYDDISYRDYFSEIILSCNKHGEFVQSPKKHLHSLSGCPRCDKEEKIKKYNEKQRKKVVEKIFLLYGEIIDCSVFEYNGYRNDAYFICKTHGLFSTRLNHFLDGHGCRKCGIERMKKAQSYDTDWFLNKAKEIHGDTYDYSLVSYTSTDGVVQIGCKIHGIFEQTPYRHIYKRAGCQICKESKGERQIWMVLKELNIDFIKQKTFCDCKGILPLRFDFYLIDQNVCIEFDGEQHFRSVFNWDFENTKNHDDIKNKFCEENGIMLLRIPYYEFDKIREKILEVISVNINECNI
jgi:very-short-patch-repair endonuclease